MREWQVRTSAEAQATKLTRFNPPTRTKAPSQKKGRPIARKARDLLSKVQTTTDEEESAEAPKSIVPLLPQPPVACRLTGWYKTEKNGSGAQEDSKPSTVAVGVASGLNEEGLEGQAERIVGDVVGL